LTLDFTEVKDTVAGIFSGADLSIVDITTELVAADGWVTHTRGARVATDGAFAAVVTARACGARRAPEAALGGQAEIPVPAITAAKLWIEDRALCVFITGIVSRAGITAFRPGRQIGVEVCSCDSDSAEVRAGDDGIVAVKIDLEGLTRREIVDGDSLLTGEVCVKTQDITRRGSNGRRTVVIVEKRGRITIARLDDAEVVVGLTTLGLALNAKTAECVEEARALERALWGRTAVDILKAARPDIGLATDLVATTSALIIGVAEVKDIGTLLGGRADLSRLDVATHLSTADDRVTDTRRSKVTADLPLAAAIVPGADASRSVAETTLGLETRRPVTHVTAPRLTAALIVAGALYIVFKTIR
jgi:hypothetical protein